MKGADEINCGIQCGGNNHRFVGRDNVPECSNCGSDFLSLPLLAEAVPRELSFRCLVSDNAFCDEDVLK